MNHWRTLINVLAAVSMSAALISANPQAPSKTPNENDGQRKTAPSGNSKRAPRKRATNAIGAANRAASSEDEGVQEAIRFERAKDAADARQARIEAAKNGGKRQ